VNKARIHDVRYRPYDGEIKGSARRAIASMARWSALRALGARRPWTAKIVPVGLALVAFGPAITVLGIKALLGSDLSDRLPGDIIPFATYYQLVAFAILAYAAIVIPETLCPDRRSRVLDLYLSTAMSPREYVMGKILASAVPLLAVTTLPLAFLYVGNVFFSDDPLGYIGSHLRELPTLVIGGVLIASLTSRRAFATVGFVLMLLLTGLTGGLLRGPLDLGPNADIINLQFQPVWLAQKIIGEAPAAAVSDGPLQRMETPDTPLLVISNALIVVVCVGILALRYRRSDA
jgi:ABC-2 type transport system permease protein